MECKNTNRDNHTMHEKGSRLQPAQRGHAKLEDLYGTIAIPALKAALDAGRRTAEPPQKQMSAALPEKWREHEAQS
jgi:hypothetical protein